MQIIDLFAREDPEALELDDDPTSYFPSFQIISPTDEDEVCVGVLSFILQLLVFCALVFSLPSFILFSIYFFYLRRRADGDNVSVHLWIKKPLCYFARIRNLILQQDAQFFKMKQFKSSRMEESHL